MNPKAARLALAGYYPLLRTTIVMERKYWVLVRRTPAGYDAHHLVAGFRTTSPTTAAVLATTSGPMRNWIDVPTEVIDAMYIGIFGGAP